MDQTHQRPRNMVACAGTAAGAQPGSPQWIPVPAAPADPGPGRPTTLPELPATPQQPRRDRARGQRCRAMAGAAGQGQSSLGLHRAALSRDDDPLPALEDPMAFVSEQLGVEGDYCPLLALPGICGCPKHHLDEAEAKIPLLGSWHRSPSQLRFGQAGTGSSPQGSTGCGVPACPWPAQSPRRELPASSAGQRDPARSPQQGVLAEPHSHGPAPREGA